MSRKERYIERSFPIVQLNPLSVRERNAFKPIYKMHKWFARRSSSIFRAILLAAALPYEDDNGQPIDLMAEFYKGHADDPRLRRPDGQPLKVLDPFMGGGTTIVEALRLGFDVTGVDYNPVAWFIVKGETTPVDLDELQAAFDRLAAKVKEPLLDLYRTPCPITGKDADIIYGFWVKQGLCTDPTCGAATDLFKNYEVARKPSKASITYLPVTCPHCDAAFDWELNRCTITAGGPQIEGIEPQGKRSGVPYAFGPLKEGVACPSCQRSIQQGALGSQPKKKRKKIPLHVLIDPSTGDFFEIRGKIPPEVTAPVSGHTFTPKKGTTSRGKFVCSTCGRQQAIVDAAEANGAPLPFRYYGFYAHTPHVGRGKPAREARLRGLDTNNDKWFAPAAEVDQAKIKDAEAEMERVRDQLPLPDQEIPPGRNFRDLLNHQYRRWSDLFSPRQLLALGTLLKAIGEEPHPELRDALLGAFQSCVDFHSILCRFNLYRESIEGTTSAHDYRNPTTVGEGNTWGAAYGRGSFYKYFKKYTRGIRNQKEESLYRDGNKDVIIKNKMRRDQLTISLSLDRQPAQAESGLFSAFDFIITDPPYAGSVQYAEMSDYFYVWLHQVLKEHYPEEFGPEITLKSQEIIEDTMMKDTAWYFEQLTEAWRECRRVLKDDGLMAFTFHHKEGDRWTGLLRSLFDAGFYLVAAYPTHSEALNSIVIQATGGITYDIIHVCRKRPAEVSEIPWSLLRREVLRETKALLRQLEAGGDVLPGPDVGMILLGGGLRLFSQHYGGVLDEHGEPLEMDEAMARLLVLVREVRDETPPLPVLLQEADGLSQLYLMHVVGAAGWTRDGLHIELQGYAHGPDDLVTAGLIEADPEDRKRYRPVGALARFGASKEQVARGRSLVDRLHLVLGVLEAGEALRPWLERWRGGWEPLAEGLRHMARRDATLKGLAEMGRRQIEAMGPETPPGGPRPGELFK